MELKTTYDDDDAVAVMQSTTDDSPLKKARWHFGTGLNKVDEIRERRCTWTVKGWKQVPSLVRKYLFSHNRGQNFVTTLQAEVYLTITGKC
jgi:hypothetical protein